MDRANQAGDVAGVFESGTDVSYFYLYKSGNAPKERILGAIQVASGIRDFSASDVDILWYEDDSKVGLFIRKALWAYFDLVSGRGYSGRYPTASLKWSGQQQSSE